jgi:hypothetical protein
MAINYVKNQPNGSVIIHADATGSVILTGNSTVSNVALAGEYVIGSTIRQVWAGSVSPNIWTVTKGNSTVNSTILVLDSTGWYDFAGSGGSINIAEAGETLYLTLSGGTGYIMLDVKKIVGPSP